VEAGENPLQAANREIMEEVGYEAKKLTIMKQASLVPTHMEHITTMVLAQNLTPHRIAGDEPEELEVIQWNINDLDRLLMRDDFAEGRSLAALFLMQYFLKQEKILHKG